MHLTKDENGEWLEADPNAPKNFANALVVESEIVRANMTSISFTHSPAQHQRWACVKVPVGPKKLMPVDFIYHNKEQFKEINEWVKAIDPNADPKLNYIECEADILGYTPSSGMPPEQVLTENQARDKAFLNDEKSQQLKKFAAKPGLRS